jgi:hypothetical protein
VADRPAWRSRQHSAALPSFGIAKTRYGECLPNEVHAGLAAARILHVENGASSLYHCTERNVGDLLLMEYEFHQRLLH